MEAEKRIALLLEEYSLNPIKIKENSEQKLPDYEVFKGDDLKFYCEVKNIEKDLWLQKISETAEEEELYGGLRSDPIFNRLTKHIHKGAKQLTSINSTRSFFNVIAFYNEDKHCGFDGLLAVLTGNFYAQDGSVHPIYKNFSEGRIKDDIKNIDLFIWLSTGKKAQFMFNYNHGVDKVHELCTLFDVDPETIIQR